MKAGHLIGRCNTAKSVALLVGLCLIVALVPSCGSREAESEEGEMALTVSSPVFKEGERIPAKHPCEGQDISPPLTWGEPPKGTRSFALIMDDPDAPGGIFTHWVLFNLPADNRELLESVPTQGQLSNGALQGKNGFGRTGYGGPCPPPGHPHRYQFTLYALDQPLNLKAGVSRKQVIDAMRGHILAQGRLMGIYQR